MGAFFQFIANLLWGPPAPPPPPPANSYFGFQWVPGIGAPGTLDPVALALIPPGAAGLYVGFQCVRLWNDCLRVAPPPPGPIAPVYDYLGSPFMPVAPCAAVTNLIGQLQANPPAGENWAIPLATQIDLTGYLRYATWCLNLIDQTAAGTAQLTALRTGALQTIIGPFFGGNAANAFGAGVPTDAVATTLRAFDQNGTPLNKAAIRAAIDQHYNGLAPGLARYNQLAADVYAMLTYSLFIGEGLFAANILTGNFLYLGAAVSGADLMAWLSVGGFPNFEAWLLGNALVTGINLRRFFFMALTIILQDSSAPQAGRSTEVNWNVLDWEQNNLLDPDWRPPAIGLCHELMHAYYNTAGTALGYDNNDYTATPAELQATGIIPFNGNLVGENQVRAQWGGIVPAVPDPTNTPGVVIPRRTIYTVPIAPQTPVSLRNNGNHI
jgi:Effector protein